MLALALFFSFGITSCDEIKDATKQKITVEAPPIIFAIDSTDYNATKTTNEATLVVLDQEISINVAQALEDAGFSLDNLTEGELTGAVLTIEYPSSILLNFFDEITLYVVDNGVEKVIATSTSVDPSTQSITLTCNGDNILEYINNDPLHVILKVSPTIALPVPTIGFTLTTTYQVEVEVL